MSKPQIAKAPRRKYDEEIKQDYDHLRQQRRRTEQERDILKNPPGGPSEHFQPHDLTLCYQLVTELALDSPVERLSKTLTIRRSAYYTYQAGQSYRLTEEKRKLRQAVVDNSVEHRRRDGNRRLLAELQEQGDQVGWHPDMVLKIRTRNFFNFVYHEPIPTTQTKVYRRV